MRNSRYFAALVAALGTTTGAGAVVASSTASESRIEILVQATQAWNGSRYTHYPQGQPELTMARITLPPHTTLPWHAHPSPNVAYVVSGSLTLQSRGNNASRTFQAGDAIAEIMGDIHRGVTGNEPAVLLVAYSGVEGLPLSMPAEDVTPAR